MQLQRNPPPPPPQSSSAIFFPAAGAYCRGRTFLDGGHGVARRRSSVVAFFPRQIITHCPRRAERRPAWRVGGAKWKTSGYLSGTDVSAVILGNGGSSYIISGYRAVLKLQGSQCVYNAKNDITEQWIILCSCFCTYLYEVMFKIKLTWLVSVTSLPSLIWALLLLFLVESSIQKRQPYNNNTRLWDCSRSFNHVVNILNLRKRHNSNSVVLK